MLEGWKLVSKPRLLRTTNNNPVKAVLWFLSSTHRIQTKYLRLTDLRYVSNILIADFILENSTFNFRPSFVVCTYSEGSF